MSSICDEVPWLSSVSAYRFNIRLSPTLFFALSGWRHSIMPCVIFVMMSRALFEPLYHTTEPVYQFSREARASFSARRLTHMPLCGTIGSLIGLFAAPAGLAACLLQGGSLKAGQDRAVGSRKATRGLFWIECGQHWYKSIASPS
jgi:hypothetical protein